MLNQLSKRCYINETQLKLEIEKLFCPFSFCVYKKQIFFFIIIFMIEELM